MKNRIQLLYLSLAFLVAKEIQYIVVMCFQMIYGPTSAENQYLESVIGVGICGAIFFLWYRFEINNEIGIRIHHRLKVKNIILITILGIASQILFSGILNMLQPYLKEIFEDYHKQIVELSEGNKIVVLCLLLFVAPVTEELIFRGVILRQAESILPFAMANLLQAVLFGLYHMNLVQGVYAACFGMILGLVCHRYKTIVASILLHMIINGSSLLLGNVYNYLTSYLQMTLIGGIIFFIALLPLIPARRQKE